MVIGTQEEEIILMEQRSPVSHMLNLRSWQSIAVELFKP